MYQKESGKHIFTTDVFWSKDACTIIEDATIIEVI